MTSILLSPPLMIFGFFFVMFLPILFGVLRQPRGEEKDRDIAYSLGTLLLMFVGSLLLSNPIRYFQVAFGDGGVIVGILASLFGVGGAGMGFMQAYFFARNLRSWVRFRTGPHAEPPAVFGVRNPQQPAVEVEALPPAEIPSARTRREPRRQTADVMDEQIRRIAATERPERVSNVKKISEDVVLVSSRRRRPVDGNA